MFCVPNSVEKCYKLKIIYFNSNYLLYQSQLKVLYLIMVYCHTFGGKMLRQTVRCFVHFSTLLLILRVRCRPPRTSFLEEDSAVQL